MERRLVLAVAVTLLVVTSGCLGILGGGGGDGAADGTPTATQTTETSETTATTTATSDDDQSSSQGPLVGQYEVHSEQLDAAGSFTTVIRFDATTANATTAFEATYRIDLGADRYLSNQTGETPRTSFARNVYTTGNTTYLRSTRGDRTQYQVGSEPYEARLRPVDVGAAKGVGVSEDFAAHDFERDGTGQFRGEEMTRYVASGPEAYGRSAPDSIEEITTFEVTVLVDDRGIVRRIEQTLEGRNADGQAVSQYAVLEITDVGTTEVTEPDWTDTAEEEADDGGE